MGIALLSAKRSKDPNTQVGACIVTPENKIVGIGYNGFPTKCDESQLPWERTAASILDTKYPYVIHAELNAILNSNIKELKDCRLYVTLHPCNECAKIIIQSGINEVIYLNEQVDFKSNDSVKAAIKLFSLSNIRCYKYDDELKIIEIYS